jgi:signal peptidase I
VFRKGEALKKALREVIETVILALVIFLGVRAAVQNFVVDGSSMEPSLHDGEVILVNKLAYLFGSPQRGDVVVLRSPRDPDRDIIKRIIGLPGETVEIKNGKVYIDVFDGRPLEEPYIHGKPRGSMAPTKIEENHYFVLGDNRARSLDSRQLGLMPKENIIGKAWLALWPISEWGLAPNFPVMASEGP